jgi:hypothetical protein
VINFSRRWDRTIITSVAVATALSAAFATPAASAVTTASAHGKPSKAAGGTRHGDNGDVKIHSSTTAVTDQRNEPHVCIFYLDAFGFDAAQSVSWRILSWPPTGSRSVVGSGALVLDSSGNGNTGDMSLPNGHYKLFWNFVGEKGFAKQKVFWVKCPATTSSHKHKKKKVPSVPSAPSAKPVRSTLPVTG